MRLIDDENGLRLVTSASDLKAAAECEFAWLRAIDARLGRVPAVEEPEDFTVDRTIRLGLEHEHAVLDAYRARGPVVELPEVRSSDAAGMTANVAATIAALNDPDVPVIYQATFATDDFVGFADFLVRDTGAGDGAQGGAWVVQDTKLARRARVTALMQLAAYVDQLDRLGIPHADRVELLLGDGTTSVHAVDDLMPVFRLRRARLRELIASRRIEERDTGAPVAWGDDRYVACGRCATCEIEVEASRDLLLVAGMRPVQRERLRRAGITTIDELAVAGKLPDGMSYETFALLKTQARLQLQSERRAAAEEGDPPPPVYEVVAPKAIAALPRPSRGDIFFDFEGDPLYTEGAAATGVRWGIDYLFGWVDTADRYSALWAHSFAEERQAFEDFLDFVAVRRAAHPDMHIYHYAPYETSHLAAMAATYGVREADVDRLLRDGVFVDLYPVVRRALRVGSRSYSIKKLEPLYMAARTTDVQRGDDSIVQYVHARALAGAIEGPDASRALAAHPEANAVLQDIAGYNRDDCVSTRLLRDWLVERAREAGLRPAFEPEPDERAYAPSALALALTARADALAEDRHATADDGGALPTSPGEGIPTAPSADERALRLGAAAIDYYPREAKSFWSTHFLRLREPISIWEQTRDVVVLDAERCRLLEDWHRGEGQRTDRRRMLLRGELAPGTRVSEGSDPFLLYDVPAPFPFTGSPRFIHADHRCVVVEVLEDGAIVDEYAVEGMTWPELPLAITPTAPPPAGNQQKAIDAWAQQVAASAPGFPSDPATDLLRRMPPRTRSGTRPDGADDVDVLVDWLRDLDDSYLAVQGPPGTGKTYVGSHVIERLVREHGYKVGVVAQSHAVVEHMLDRVVAAGVPADLVGKAIKGDASAPDAVAPSFTVFAKNGVAEFTAQRQESGYVIGGTAWDFSHEGRVPRGSLDLLVIDEAGQFSLASTIAVSLAAHRLLLLGDPQQLPQVSQGTHPEPVDTSALGWIMQGDAVLDPAYGRFLAQTRRMHPRVAEPVSHLSYAGRLAAYPTAALRAIEGIEPGLHVHPLAHRGNATAAPEEAAEVVRIVQDLIGRAFTDLADDGEPAAPRALTVDDIIVVTPYNAQQATVHEALTEAGFGEVRVGTVDKFQGQEAAVSIVSLAASSARDAPRGPEFLLLQNRLNVAISRAEVAAFLVYSPALLDDFPRTPEGVARLSAFARLVGAS